jgi:hypothetical protein
VTEPRTCPDCGVAEDRRIVGGRELVNLDPVTGRCVECLVRHAKRIVAAPAEPRDWQRAAAGDTEQ